MLSDLKFYFSLFIRRIHYFLIVAISVAAFGVSVAYTLPPVYEADAQLLVESPQIPGNLASSTVEVSAAEILQIIRQRILTRANMLEISREFGVHKDQRNMSPDAIVADMRKRISMRLPRNRDAAAFVSIGFRSDYGPMSAQVTNELVSRILAENITMRKAASGQTLEFFENEVSRLDKELADQGQAILEFKLAHKDALPDSLNFRRSRQAAMQERLVQAERELVSLRERRARLQDIYERTGTVSPGSETALTSDQKQLALLQNELTTALAIYSEQNPKIRALRLQIAAQESKVAQQSGVTDTSEELTPYEIQVLDIEGQIEFLSQDRDEIEKELSDLKSSIERTPANAITLGTLERDYENLRAQYNAATSKLAAAQTGDQIEAQSRGQRITVIEQAVAPREPTSPNRRKIAMAGIGGGVLMGLALVVIIELLHSSIRRPADLRNQLGITPFGAIPYIRSKRETIIRRTIIIGALLFVAIGIPIGLYLLDQHYLPMDLMIERTLTKLGILDLLDQLGFTS